MTVSQTNPGQLHPPEGEEPESRIVQVGPAQQLEAVQRLVAVGSPNDRANAQRFMHYAKTNGIQLDAMWGRVDREDRIVQTVLAVPNPGRTAMVFASHPGSPQEVQALGKLIDHAAGRLATREVHLAQLLLEPDESLERQAALAGGFSELATLTYLQRPVSKRTLPASPQWSDGAATEAFAEHLYDDFLLAVMATYEDTLDCPKLFGLREPQDILAGHRATGKFDPSLWTLLRVDGKPVGVVLLNPFPEQRTIELVYLGLAPVVRGRGLGRQLLRHALRLLHGRRERIVTLAVDEQNAPALRIYRAEGFRDELRRVALIRSLRNDSR